MNIKHSIKAGIYLLAIIASHCWAFAGTDGNLLLNPGFEEGLAFWNTAGASAYWFVDRDFTDPEEQGVGAVAIANAGDKFAQITQCVPVQKGATYIQAAWTTAFCAGNAQLSIRWTTDSCATNVSENTSSASITVGDWEKLEAVATAPANATDAIVGLTREAECGDVVFYDDASFTKDTLFRDSFESNEVVM